MVKLVATLYNAERGLYAASTESAAYSASYWRTLEGRDFELVELLDVPDDVAEQLLAHGTDVQYYGDDYEAFWAALPYQREGPFFVTDPDPDPEAEETVDVTVRPAREDDDSSYGSLDWVIVLNTKRARRWARPFHPDAWWWVHDNELGVNSDTMLEIVMWIRKDGLRMRGAV